MKVEVSGGGAGVLRVGYFSSLLREVLRAASSPCRRAGNWCVPGIKAESLAPSLPVGETAVCYERFTDVAGLVERAQQGSMPA